MTETLGVLQCSQIDYHDTITISKPIRGRGGRIFLNERDKNRVAFY